MAPERKKREYKEMEEKHAGDQHAKVDMNTVSIRAFIACNSRSSDQIQIQFTATDLYDKEKVDIEHVVMEEVLQLLQCGEGGLTDAEAQNRIGIFGPNKLQEKKEK